MGTNVDEYKDYYKDKLAAAQKYQDFICRELHKHGLVLQNMTSQEQQLDGENLLGLEIKFDDLIPKYQRLYIEVAEKADPSNAKYVPSGIYRNDASWLYGIGDYAVFYIFGKKMLVRLDKHAPDWLYRPPPTPTSQAFCIPIAKANEIAERVIHFEDF